MTKKIALILFTILFIVGVNYLLLTQQPDDIKEPSIPVPQHEHEHCNHGTKNVKMSAETKKKIVQQAKSAFTKLSPALKQTHKKYIQRLGEDYTINISPLRFTQANLKGQKRKVQEVIIEVLTDKNKRYSFQAYIDPDNGQVLQTWNQERKDGLFFKHQKHRTFNPTGTVRQE